MSCSPFNPSDCMTEALNTGIEALAKGFADGASWAVKTLMTAWLGVPSPDVSSPGSTVAWLEGRLSYFVLVAMFVSVLYAAYRMATTGQFEHAADLGHALLRMTVISGCVGVATTIALEVGDAYAAWILKESHVNIAGALVLTAIVNPAVLMLLSIVVILAQLVQVFIMLAKNAMVVALVAFIPITSAATNTQTGKQGYQKALTWLAAFVLYKPVAAIIYAISFNLASADKITGQLSGIACMVLAVFALPALMRFLVPATAAATGGNSGALAGAVVGAGIATGAVIATGGAAAGGFAGAAGPTGAISAGATGASLGASPSRGTSITSGDEK